MNTHHAYGTPGFLNTFCVLSMEIIYKFVDILVTAGGGTRDWALPYLRTEASEAGRTATIRRDIISKRFPFKALLRE